MATRQELHEEYKIVRLMNPKTANEQLTEAQEIVYRGFLEATQSMSKNFDKLNDDSADL
ncbi:hypothetical protein C8E03_108130 [Lachnotalea glycerini]|uniref:Uncharacterized protein n=1 Tax=Lachnotalea glycerini TaxID=1763509 RepID=A0A318EPV5_9FIRM|nr:hypothetical protein [Lachnotalea glycerini]PXV88403.1 hypothetical protein C8E03_108130 [Lachnotalea glycerini]